jgi:hypothetical protein
LFFSTKRTKKYDDESKDSCVGETTMKKIMLGLLVIVIMLMSASFALAEHTVDISLSPEWSAPSIPVTYTATIENNGPDAIREVFIYKHPSYGPLTCPAVPHVGWKGVLLEDTYDSTNDQTTDACYFYTSGNVYNIPSGDTLAFNFDTTTPAEESCELTWLFRTIDQVQAQAFGQWIESTATTGVDNKKPEFVKTVTGPQALNGDLNVLCPNGPADGEYCHITDETVISVVVTDPGAEVCTASEVVPSGMHYCEVEVLVDNVVDSYYDQTIYDSDDQIPNSISFEVQFEENTEHELRFVCYDNAGNKLEDAEMFRVDMSAPTTTIDLQAGNKYYANNGMQWLDTDSAISISAFDNPTYNDNICAIGLYQTFYREFYFGPEDEAGWAPCESISACENFDGGETSWSVYEGGLLSPGEESCHVIESYSVDAFGHEEAIKRECYFVDKTPPTMEKTVGEPRAPMCDYREHSVSGSTDIALAGYGGSPFNMTEDIGGYFGWNSFDILVTTNIDGTVDFDLSMPRNLYTEPDNFDLVIDADNDGTPDFLVHYYVEMDEKVPVDSHWSYKAYDESWSANEALPLWISATPNLNGVSDFTITIDAEMLGGCGATFGYGVQAPLADEGSDFIQGNGEAAVIMFPENVGNLFGGTDNYELVTLGNNMDWYVTTDTPIDLYCEDAEPHPSGNEHIFWSSYIWSGDGWELETEDDFLGTHYQFNFEDVSRHKLEWYCEDAVGKTTATDVEYFNVDNEPPVITKQVIGPKDGDCPPEPNTDEFCNIKGGETQVVVSVEDFEADHMSNDVKCTYEVEWNNDLLESGTFGEEGKTFVWNEDSAHILTLVCKDAVGNSVTDVEEFRVDMKPPVTTKTYDEPEVLLENGKTYRWITSATDITLSAVDEKIGVEGIYYTHEWVSDAMCEAYPTPTYFDHLWGDYPSTNNLNRDKEAPGHEGDDAPHVNVLNTGLGFVELEFVNLAPGLAFFEYRIDGVEVGSTAHPVVPGDVIHPGVSVASGNTIVQTFNANSMVEVRLVLGGERDWDFDWTRFDVLPDTTGWEYASGDSVMFNIPDESCHIIQYYAVDVFGNVEDIQTQYVMVDETAPTMTKSIGEPKVACDESEDCHYYMTQQTPITFECVDAGPHPVDDVTMYINVFWKETFADTWSEVPDHEFVKNQETWTFTPHKDSMHKFEYWCEDKLGNAGDLMTEIDVVDTLGPDIETTIDGPYEIEQCSAEGPSEVLEQTSCVKWDCEEEMEKDFFVTGRQDDTNWDRAIWEGYQATPEVTGEHTWISGEGVDFSVSYDPLTGKVTYELGGQTLEYTYETGKAFEYIVPFAKGDANGNHVELTDMQLNGIPVNDVDSGETYMGNQIALSDADQVNGFTLTGVATLTWNGAHPQEVPAFHVYAMNTHDLCMPKTYINGVTKIIVDATDVEPHPVGDVMCKFTYDVVGGNKEGLDEEDTFMAVPFEINFPEESEHHLTIECKDALGNSASLTEEYFVDKTAPGIWKDYEFLFSDYYGEGEGTYWAKFTSADGLVFASVADDGPHKSGIAEVKYKVSMAENDEMCKYPPRQLVDDGNTNGFDPRYDFDCAEASEGDWTIVDEADYADFSFVIGEESCHVIEIMAIDNVDKCRLHKQFVYVDETAPLTAKQIGMPKAPMSQQNIDLGQAFYPELNAEFCSAIDAQGNPKCSDVTLLTPITLGCHDPEPHPSGATDVCYMVDFDGDDITAESYCANGVMNEDGYCCVSSDSEVEFYFGEESWHKLSYYCVDNVGNVGEPDIEYFKVEGTAFDIKLNKKWNLVSVPVKLLDNSMQEVFADHEDSVVGVWTYEDGVWYGYSPDGVSNDNLDTMNPGWGYWILTTEADTLTIGGSLFSPGPINPAGKAIYPGWNLIGYYGAEGQPGYYGPASNGGQVTCELMSLKPSVWDHGVSSVYGYWELLGNNKWLELGFNSNMDPGAGYWVYAYEEGQYVPSTTCDFMST